MTATVPLTAAHPVTYLTTTPAHRARYEREAATDLAHLAMRWYLSDPSRDLDHAADPDWESIAPTMRWADRLAVLDRLSSGFCDREWQATRAPDLAALTALTGWEFRGREHGDIWEARQVAAADIRTELVDECVRVLAARGVA